MGSAFVEGLGLIKRPIGSTRQVGSSVCLRSGGLALSPEGRRSSRLFGVGRRALTAMSLSGGKYDYDLFVIGAGSGGVRASRVAASYGASVAIAEEARYGGTCVNVGCVPKKLFVYGSHYPEYVEEAKAFGWDISVNGLSWPRLIENKDKEITRLNGIYAKLLNGSGVKIIDGRAVLKDEHTVEVAGTTYTADKILVAVGGRPYIPDIPGKEHVITSNEAFYLEDLPKRVVLVGGGYIAVEFANIFHGYGSKVTQVYRGDLFLRGFEYDCRTNLRDQMKGRGIDLRFNTNVESVEKTPEGSYLCHLSTGDVLETDLVMYATGRVPNTGELGLDAAGVKTDKNGVIPVDPYSQTNVPNIWAIGDVTNRKQLTPVAIQEGTAFADTVYGNKPRSVEYEYIPTAIFSNPAIGTCGLTEEEARAKYGKVDIYKADFRPLKHTLSGMAERTFMKLIVDRESQVVVGCHLLEPAAGEIIQCVGIAMKMGATKQQFDATVAVHPTAAEELVTMRTKVPDPEE